MRRSMNPGSAYDEGAVDYGYPLLLRGAGSAIDECKMRSNRLDG